MRSLKKKKNIFLLRHDEDMTLICWLCLDKRTEGPVVTVQSRKHLYLLYLLPFHHHYNPIRLGVRTPHPRFSPFIFSQRHPSSLQNVPALTTKLQITRRLAMKHLMIEIREQRNPDGATDPPSILQEMTLTFQIVCGL